LVERLRLTPEFVDAATPPKQGERWVADTVIKGFGLRLWTTRSGEGKAFAIRMSSVEGKIVRKSFDPRESWEYRYAVLLEREPGQLGCYLDSARRWAYQEITRLKGQTSHAEKIERRRLGAAEQTLLRTVQEVGEDLLSGMRGRKLSEPYIDRLDKLFSTGLSDTIRNTPLGRLGPAEIAAALSAANLPPTTFCMLRAFIGRIFQKAAPARPAFYYFSRDVSAHLRSKIGNSSTRFPDLKNLTEADYRQIFQRLETETTYWQQAMCVRLHFEFWTPFNRLLAARWEDIIDGLWYPYPTSEWRLNLRYRGRIDKEVAGLLDRVRQLGTENFGPTPYWFPSKLGRKFGHIRTVDTIWRNVLHEMRAPFFPLREFALNYRHSTFYLRSIWHRLEAYQQNTDDRYSVAQQTDF
jgi:hypothetical protein